MNINFKQNNLIKHGEDSKIMQLSDFPQLSDQELELLVGGFSLNNIIDTSVVVVAQVVVLPAWNSPTPVPTPVPPTPVPPTAPS